MNISDQARPVFIVVAGLVIVGVYFLLFGQIQKERDKVLSLRRELAVIEKKQKNIQSLERLLDETEEQKRDVENIFVDDKTVVRFIEELERLAEITGAVLEIKDASLPRTDEDLGPTFSMEIEGSFKNIFRYLELLENVPFQVEFNEIRFVKPGGAGGAGAWSLAIVLRVLSYEF